jgi:RNA polymerase sigma-70 factor, ECF subfamily
MGFARRGRLELVELVDVDAPTETRVEASLPTATGQDFESFYRREFPGLVVLARVIAGPALAEDVAQEAMLVACRRWDDVQSYDSPVGWVRTVCMHKAVSLVRRRGVEFRLLRQLGSFRSDTEASMGEDWFWRAVRALPLRQAQVVALHYALGLPVAEVAVTLGCAEGTVKTHLSRARAALAESLGVPEEDPS